MTWLDFCVLIGFFGLLSLAYQRGVVLEITDFVALLAAGFMGFRMFRPVAGGMHSLLFKGWSLTFLQRFSFFVIFIVVFLVVFSIGLTIERRMKEEKYLEKIVDQRAGLAVGFFKGAWLVCILLGFLFFLDIVPPREQPKLRRGAFVRLFLGLQSFAGPTIYLVAPSDLAREFIDVGLRGKKRSKKSSSKSKEKD